MQKLRKYIKNNLIARWLYALFNWLEVEHCKKSIESDEGEEGVF